MTKKALITGASGFIGSHLFKTLKDRGWTVFNLPHTISPKFINERVGSIRPDVVFHLAGVFVDQHGGNDVGRLIDSNIRFGAHLLEAMRQVGVDRIITAGSAWEQFNSPLNLYAATKSAFRVILDYYKMRSTTLMVYNTYGPEDNRYKLFYRLRQAQATGVPLKMRCSSAQLISLSYVDDVVEEFIRAADLEILCTYSLFNALYPLGQIVSTYAEITGKPVPVIWGDDNKRVPEPAYQVLSEWTNTISLTEGIKRMEHL